MNTTRPRLLIIGAGGFVGGWVARRAGDRFEVIRGQRRALPGDAGAVRIDITDPGSVTEAFAAAQPDVVLLTAAVADIDLCETGKPLADAVNHCGPVLVARECQARGARMIFTSTDAVFDGTLPAYPEEAVPTPVNFYGHTKARAEATIRELLPAAAIVRFSLVLGRSLSPGTNSYLDKLAATLRSGQRVRAPTNEYRNPIDVATLADVLVELAARAEGGIFHIGAADKLTRFELARRLAEALGVDPALVEPQSEAIPGRAPRGIDDFLVCAALPALLGFVVPSCQQVIERAVHGTA